MLFNPMFISLKGMEGNSKKSLEQRAVFGAGSPAEHSNGSFPP